MSLAFEVYLFFQPSKDKSLCLRQVNSCFEAWGEKLTNDSTTCVVDDELEIEEYSTTNIASVSEILNKKYESVTVSYFGEFSTIDVVFHCDENFESVTCLQFVLIESSVVFVKNNKEKEFFNFIVDLHKSVVTGRTICGWGLEDGYHDEFGGISEECTKLKRRMLTGLYDIEIVQRKLVTSERMKYMKESTAYKDGGVIDVYDDIAIFRRSGELITI